MADIITSNGVTIREGAGRSGSEKVGSGVIMRTFICRGSSDPLFVRQQLIINKNALQLEEFEGLYFDSLEWDLIAGPDNWRFKVGYSTLPDVGGYNISMDSSGGTMILTEAFAQTKYNASGQTGPDFGKSINVQDGMVEGVERVIPALKFDVDARIATSYIISPIAYAKVVASLTGYTNSSPYLTFAAGELLFTGATGQIIGDNPRLTFSFVASPNLTGLQLGDITGISKGGHDYVWFSYRNDQDGSTGLTTAKARAAYVSRIYGQADFSALRIGEV
jgi:hypothetical protein